MRVPSMHFYIRAGAPDIYSGIWEIFLPQTRRDLRPRPSYAEGQTAPRGRIMFESVRVHLTLWYTAVLALVLIVLALAGYFIFWQDTVRRTDSDLAELSSAFLTTLRAELGDQSGPVPLRNAAQVAITEHRFRDHVFAVLDPAGRLFITSLDLPSAKPASELIRADFFASTSFRKFAEASLRDDALFQNVRSGEDGYRGIAQHFRVQGQTYTLVVLRSLHPQQEMLQEITTTFAWVIPIAVLLASAGGYFLARKSLAPVVAMSTQAGRIGAANLYERLPVQNDKDELGHLARSFNQLLDRLNESFDRQRRCGQPECSWQRPERGSCA